MAQDFGAATEKDFADGARLEDAGTARYDAAMPLFGRRRKATPATANEQVNSGQPAQQVEPVNDTERQWIDDHLRRLADVGVRVDDPAQLGAYYDRRLTEWLATPEQARLDPNPEITLIGIGLGELMRRRTGLEWAVVTDDQGTELALYGQPGNVLTYPVNSIAKRWAEGQTGLQSWLPSFVDENISTINALRSQLG